MGVAAAMVAIGDEAKQAARLAAQQEQADMFAAEDARLDANLPMQPRSAGAVGRPKGSQNRKTAVVADYYLRRHGDPVEALLTLGMGGLADLAREMDELERAFPGRFTAPKDVLEILKFKKSCLAEAAPYVRSRMPVQLDVRDERRAVLIMGEIKAPASGAGGASEAMSVLDLLAEEVEEIQALSDGEPAPSHGVPSHESE